MSDDHTTTFAFTVLVSIIATLALALFARKRPFWIVRRVLSVVFRPLRGRFGFLRRVSNGSRGAAPGMLIEQSAVTSLGHVVFGQSQIDAALEAHPGVDRAHLHQGGLLFSTLEPGEGFLKVSSQISDAEAAENYEKSQIFFERDLPYFDKSGSFFEEIEGKLIIDMFEKSDIDCFYYVNETRRVGNANVRKLAIWLSVFLATFATLNIFLESVIVPLFLSKDMLSGTMGEFLRVHANTILTLLLFTVFALASGLLFFSYVWAQWNNGREMNDFINRYFSQLGQQYQYALSKCSKVHNVNSDAERKNARDTAKVWFMTLEWTAWRIFYVELFSRNAIYQMWRNSGSYIFYIPLVFLIALVAGAEYLGATLGRPELGLLQPGSHFWQLHWLNYVSMGLLAALYLVFLSTATRRLLGAIKPGEWSGFRKREYRKTVGDLVGLYVGEIVFQRYKGQFQQDAAGIG